MTRVHFLPQDATGLHGLRACQQVNHDSHEDHVCMCISARINKYSAPFIVVMGRCHACIRHVYLVSLRFQHHIQTFNCPGIKGMHVRNLHGNQTSQLYHNLLADLLHRDAMGMNAVRIVLHFCVSHVFVWGIHANLKCRLKLALQFEIMYPIIARSIGTYVGHWTTSVTHLWGNLFRIALPVVGSLPTDTSLYMGFQLRRKAGLIPAMHCARSQLAEKVAILVALQVSANIRQGQCHSLNHLFTCSEQTKSWRVHFFRCIKLLPLLLEGGQFNRIICNALQHTYVPHCHMNAFERTLLPL